MPSDGDVKELRLALVCYGGSSLAIYMHGVTKEIHRLVRGSALLEDDEVDTASPTEKVYAKLLRELETRRQVRTRVVVDIVAGTSAGGINGICLAKAIASNRSLDRLRNLWFERGQIDGLLDASHVPTRVGKLAFVAEEALRTGRAPLKGPDMARWVHDAFTEMDKTPAQPASLSTLMPSDHLLELFVTITDHFGYDRQVPGVDPTPVYDTRHRHVLTFRFGDGDNDFEGTDANVALTFAARTTSSIPGVFPPVSLPDLERWIDADVGPLRDRFFRHYNLADVSPSATFFVDGGVLDNKPFGHAVDAIKQRSADVEVSRRLVYIEPDPGVPKPAHTSHDPPNVFEAAIGGLTGIPRSEPILDDLLSIAALNEQVARIQDIVKTEWNDIARKVKEVADLRSIPQSADDPQLETIRGALNDAARTQAGFGYATYIRTKISGVVDRYAKTACAVCDLPDDSTHALLAREVLREWARQEHLFDHSVDPATGEPAPTDRQLAFLRTFDLEYGERRLRFMIAALRAWYRNVGQADYPTRDQLDRAKSSLYDALERLRHAMDGRGYDEAVLSHFRICFAVEAMRERLQTEGFTAAKYVTEFQVELGKLEATLVTFLEETLRGFTADLYTKMLEATEGWPESRKRELLLRYLGFPFWDVLLYPIQSLTDVGERDDVKVVRISPLDTKRIPAPSATETKLVGVRTGHFGAFLSDRGGRERDYLWGRLDGAQRLIEILAYVPNESPDEELIAAWSGRIFGAILAEDADALEDAAELIEHVRQYATDFD